MTKTEFKKGIDKLKLIFNHNAITKDLSNEYLRIYYEAVQHIDNENFEIAVQHIIQTEEHFPKPNKFIKHYNDNNQPTTVINLDEMGDLYDD